MAHHLCFTYAFFYVFKFLQLIFCGYEKVKRLKTTTLAHAEEQIRQKLLEKVVTLKFLQPQCDSNSINKENNLQVIYYKRLTL